jgi:hypothetical protein
VTDTFPIDGPGAALADILERQRKRDAAAKRTWRHHSVAVGVTIVHVLIVALLIQTRIVTFSREKPVKDQPLLWLLLPRASQAPQDVNQQREADLVRQAYKAVQLLPQIEQPVRPGAITVDPGLALGQALACGAGSYEYLTPEGRRRCNDTPWHFRYDRYGYIILDARGQPAVAEKPRPSDVMAHERNTQSVCPKNIDPNAPCLGRVVHGNGPM